MNPGISVYFHILLNDLCNLNCRYCKGRLFPEIDTDCWDSRPRQVPSDIAYSHRDLCRFIRQDSDPGLIFYGGEPLLSIETIQSIMRALSGECRFLIHTNGTLLDRVPEDVLMNLETIIVSIDGRRETHDKNRGRGTYQAIIDNCEQVKKMNIPADFIGRMTVTEETDIYRDVTHLAFETGGLFSSVHWQLDANFSENYCHDSYSRWVDDSYVPGLFRLMDRWVTHMEDTGEVLRWYPFIDTMQDALNGIRPSVLRCGSGFANYSITPDGMVSPCPCMVGMTEYYCGDIRKDHPETLRKVVYDGKCTDCDLFEFCGGRCLYSQVMDLWPDEGCTDIYRTVNALSEAVRTALPRVKKCIEDNVVSPDQFDHPKFNGCEIIP